MTPIECPTHRIDGLTRNAAAGNATRIVALSLQSRSLHPRVLSVRSPPLLPIRLPARLLPAVLPRWRRVLLALNPAAIRCAVALALALAVIVDVAPLLSSRRDLRFAVVVALAVAVPSLLSSRRDLLLHWHLHLHPSLRFHPAGIYCSTTANSRINSPNHALSIDISAQKSASLCPLTTSPEKQFALPLPSFPYHGT
jgi:hypothetical protein